MGLADVLRKLRTRPPRGEKVELKPLEQVLMAYLISSGGASTAELQSKIDARRPVLAQSASEVAAALLSQGLAEMRYGFAGPDARTTFVPTAKGLRLRKLVPPNPVSVTDFWV